MTFFSAIFAFALLASAVVSQSVTVSSAVCVLEPTSNLVGNGTFSGVITLQQGATGTTFNWTISGLAPGNHSWHIHSWGVNLFSLFFSCPPLPFFFSPLFVFI